MARISEIKTRPQVRLLRVNTIILHSGGGRRSQEALTLCDRSKICCIVQLTYLLFSPERISNEHFDQSTNLCDLNQTHGEPLTGRDAVEWSRGHVPCHQRDPNSKS